MPPAPVHDIPFSVKQFSAALGLVGAGKSIRPAMETGIQEISKPLSFESLD